MKKIGITSVIAAAALVLAGCATQQKTVETTPAPAPVETVQVEANAEVMSVKELIGAFADQSDLDATMAKYGYKVKNGYEVFRVDKYNKMFYKNCRLAKVITDGKYEDYPRALRKGISSYVAVKTDNMMLGVFNDNAYQNLVDQVKMNGFRLDMEGNEDIYTDGTYYIACNKSNRTLRIQKVS